MESNTISRLSRSLRRLPFAICLLALADPAGVSEQRIRADLDYLCSDALQGRLSLSKGAEEAATYIAAEFAKAKLAPPAGGSYLQEFPLVAYTPDRERTRLALARNDETTPFRYGPDFTGGYWKELTIHAPVVFAGYGITAPEYHYDDYAGLDVRGKVVLVFEHEPQENDPRSAFNGTGHTVHGNARVKTQTARAHGAVAILLAGDPLRKHSGAFDPPAAAKGPRSLRANAPRQAIEEDSIPLLQVSDPVAAELLKAAGPTPAAIATAIDKDLKPRSMPLPRMEIDVTTAPANLRHGVSSNAVGILPGSDPSLHDETVMLTAHYDHLGAQNGHVYPGANDNASGAVAVMELARMFAGRAGRPRRSILFVVFGSEEEGMLGSNYYVEHPLRPLETTRAVLNLDMIGRDEAHIPQSEGVVEILGDTRNEINLVGVFLSPDLKNAIQQANRKTGLELSTKFDQDHDLNALFRCDHFPFLARGVPAAWLFGGWHPGYHEPSDTIDTLNFPKLMKVTRLAFDTAASLADSAKPPKFVAAGHR